MPKSGEDHKHAIKKIDEADTCRPLAMASMAGSLTAPQPSTRSGKMSFAPVSVTGSA